ncbi:fasciclin domain-containing protein [Zalerion maritima]|uniref:Fasciclin domain-containing protein n=1 Tax=Zalerion maritima TaxID=339359 RepID=A0AAD5WSW3_9PEZI|nr:fasciclin domain-containing protein [Zalerion maritima]
MRFTLASLAALATSVAAQSSGNLTASLLSSISDRDDVGVFKGLLSQLPTLIDDVLSDAKNGSKNLTGNGQVTLLIPNDVAIGSFLAEYPDTEDLQAALMPVMSYHVMAAPLKGTNFTQPNGLTIPTFLDGEDESGTSYNLRAPAPAIQEQYGQGATGQVLFAKLEGLDSVKLRTRQGDGSGQSSQSGLRSGMGQVAMMDIVDGEWDGGVYQIVNAVLEPPAPCSNTIRSLKDSLSALDTALNKTDLWATLNTTPNVTCLAPNTDAFQSAGNPQDDLPVDDLTQALLDHTLHSPTYTNYLVDGMKIATASNKTVRVTLNDTGIWFNDAKVVEENILTNNGLVHVLDRVMTFTDDDSDDGSDDGSDDSGSGDSSEDDDSDDSDDDDENVAGVLKLNGVLVGAAALVAFALL